MNSEKHRSQAIPPQNRSSERGNVVIYVLIALGLLALLTATLSDQNNVSDTLDEDTLLLQTAQLKTHAASAQGVVEQMVMGGTDEDDLIFLRPAESTFDTAPYYNKVYHPQGGGLSIPILDTDVFPYTGGPPAAGWYMGRFTNIAWTPTTADDIVLVAYGISQGICAQLNKDIKGDNTIPTLSSNSAAAFFIDASITSIANVDFSSGACATCVGYPALCVEDNGGGLYAYYQIISAR